MFTLTEYISDLKGLRIELLLSAEVSDKVATSQSWLLKARTCHWFPGPTVWEDGQKLFSCLCAPGICCRVHGKRANKNPLLAKWAGKQASICSSMCSFRRGCCHPLGLTAGALQLPARCSLHSRGSAWQRHNKQPLCVRLPNFYHSPICLVFSAQQVAISFVPRVKMFPSNLSLRFY